ncbi:MAG TPA: N-acetyltransferase [Gemmataceae bacterium]|nr:N-acetyltransferase [Gemmataceae bacterium]
MIPSTDQYRVTYFKRFKMEVDLHAVGPVPPLAEGYGWVAWEEILLDIHADVMFRSFYGEIDSFVFPSLGDRIGSRVLMHEIRRKSGFVPQATWLLMSGDGYCGCIQGLVERSGLGAIQNLAVTARHRGRGLGSALLLQALHGFNRLGLDRAGLEVTAQNEGAVRLYQRLGFRRRKTLYKAVDFPSNLNDLYPSSPVSCPVSQA